MSSDPADEDQPPNRQTAQSESQPPCDGAGNFSRPGFPIVLLFIVVANFVVFGLMLRDGMDFWWVEPAGIPQLLKWGANYAPWTTAGDWWRICTAIFLHAGFIHLALNMLSLVSIGLVIELFVGRLGFLVLYLSTGLTASLASVWARDDAVALGASGAVFGVAGALVSLVFSQWRTLPARMRRGGVILTINLLVVIGVCHFLPFVDNVAHLAGLLAGCVGGLIMSVPRSRVTRGRRLLRTGCLGLLGALTIFLGIRLHPGPPVDMAALTRRVDTLQQQSNLAHQRIVARYKVGALNSSEVAEAYERRVLQPLESAWERVQTPGRMTPDQRRWASLTKTYLMARKEAITMEAQALRSGDADLLKQAREQHQQANKIAEQLNALNP